MTNIIKSALIIGSLLAPVAAYAGDAKPVDKKTTAGAGSGSAAPAPSTDKKPSNDVKKPVTKPKAGAGGGSGSK